MFVYHDLKGICLCKLAGQIPYESPVNPKMNKGQPCKFVMALVDEALQYKTQLRPHHQSALPKIENCRKGNYFCIL